MKKKEEGKLQRAEERRKKWSLAKNRGSGAVLWVLGSVLVVACGATAALFLPSEELGPEGNTEVYPPALEWNDPEATLPSPLPSEVPSIESQNPEVEAYIEPYDVRILGVGDNLIHSSIFLQAAKRSTLGTYDFWFAYENMQSYIQEADIASINQETMLARSFAPSGYPRFNSPVQMADTIRDLGFDVVSLSNNHMYDVGEQGLKETLELLKWDYGFMVSGAYLSQEDYLSIPVRTIGDVVVGFVATTQTTNGLSLPSNSTLVGSVTANDAQTTEFLAQIKRATQVADIVVANIHWGTEYTHTPTTFQYNLAQQAIEAGVDIIFGHHPHVIQPVEFITRSDGTQGVVCYSLGNFISTQDQATRMIGGMLDVTLSVQGEDISISEVQFLPVITHYGAGVSNVQVYPYDLYTKELANAHGLKAVTYPFIYKTVTSVVAGEFLPWEFHTLYQSS